MNKTKEKLFKRVCSTFKSGKMAEHYRYRDRFMKNFMTDNEMASRHKFGSEGQL